MDSIGALHVFVQVAESRSFAATGRAVGVSASAIGKRVGMLEDQLGARLFHRSTRNVALTAEGALFLARARRILAEVEAAQAELSQVNPLPRGRLRISLPLIAEPFLSVLAAFRHACPEVELDLEFTDRQVDIIEEGYDAVIRSGDAPDSRLTARVLGSFSMMLVAAPDYLSRHGTPRQASDLSQHACIQFRFPHNGRLQPWPFSGANLPQDFLLPASIICNNLQARIAFALQGLGIAYLPDFAIGAQLAAGRLVHVLPQCAENAVPFHVMWPSRKHMAPKLRAFVDFLKERLFAGLPG